MKVLIVDDSPEQLRAVSRALTRLGWSVQTSETPLHPCNVDVVLTDWQPHGPAMLEQCLFAAVPVVVFTSDVDLVDSTVPVVSKLSPIADLDRALRSVR